MNVSPATTVPRDRECDRFIAFALSILTSGDENHLCGVGLRKSHKISSKAHRHACAHRVGTPIARPEKLP